MTAPQRREQIEQLLQKSETPLSASTLAAQLCVSRQIVVGDIALLRAAGLSILATPRGYLLDTQPPVKEHLVVACRHSAAQLKDELYTIVDCGCGILDVIVEHPVYGQLSGQLHIFSRYDADLFCDTLEKTQAQPLCYLTDDLHLHTLFCPTLQHQNRVLQKLSEHGYLYGK